MNDIMIRPSEILEEVPRPVKSIGEQYGPWEHGSKLSFQELHLDIGKEE